MLWSTSKLGQGNRYLGGKELGRRVGVGVEGRDVDEPVNIVLGHGLGDPLGTLDVHVGEGEVPRSVSPGPVIPSAASPLTW
jgi:hypothetical protein